MLLTLLKVKTNVKFSEKSLFVSPKSTNLNSVVHLMFSEAHWWRHAAEWLMVQWNPQLKPSLIEPVR